MQKKQEFICKNLDEGMELAIKFFHLSEEKIFLNIIEENENEMKVEALVDINLALEGKRYIESIYKLFEVPKEKIEETINFINQFDMKLIANNVIETLYDFISKRT